MLGEKGLETLGIVTFDDDTCKSIKIVESVEFGEQYHVGKKCFQDIKDLYIYISGKAPDRMYEEIEVEEKK